MNVNFKRDDVVWIKPLRSYLVGNGWLHAATIGDDLGTVWHHPSSEDHEILLPSRLGVKDFSARMFDVFNVLGDFHECSVSDVGRLVLGYCMSPGKASS